MDEKWLPAMIELSSQRFHLPTSAVFDGQGNLYVAESGLPLPHTNDKPAGGKIWRITPEGERHCLMAGLRPPVNGLSIDGDLMYVAEGGNPGRISVIDLTEQTRTTVLDNLPGGGNYHTNMAVMGDDGWLYFGQGALTNSGIVGPDASQVSWLRQCPHPADIAGGDITLTGFNANCADPQGTEQVISTGAFQPFGQTTVDGQALNAQLPCTAAVMRCLPDGSKLELVAWGLRNPYGLGFDQAGRLLAIDLGINDRGSRPVGQVPDCLYQVQPGHWYGWPDYAAGIAVSDKSYSPFRGQPATALIANPQTLGELAQPLFSFVAHAAPTKFTCEPKSNQLVIAMFGDKLPMTGPPGPNAGRCVIRLNPDSGVTEVLTGHQFQRPIDVIYSPDGSLYVVDFGHFEMFDDGVLDLTVNSGAVICIAQPIFEPMALLYNRQETANQNEGVCFK
ncbi:MAG: glucose/arabinose dehydrogenase [Phenylobacterium sp.]|jgi:glucose/arabinose dehydrogenase